MMMPYLGFRPRDSAQVLGITEGYARNLIYQMMELAGVENKLSLAFWLVKQGYLGWDDFVIKEVE